MQDLLTLVLMNALVPGVAAGFVIGMAKRRGPSGLVADAMLGGVGGLGGGLLTLGLMQKLHVASYAGSRGLVVLGALGLAAAIITMARGAAVILTEATERTA